MAHLPAVPITPSIPRHRPLPTGVSELDRVLGGGLVPGSVTLLAGSGGGQVDAAAGGGAPLGQRGPARALLSGEESAGQIGCAPNALDEHAARGTGRRIGPADALGHIDEVGRRWWWSTQCRPCPLPRPTVHRWGHPGAGGDHRAHRDAKTAGVARRGLLVGHVTKDGAIAGPRSPGASRRRRTALRGRPHVHAAQSAASRTASAPPTGRLFPCCTTTGSNVSPIRRAVPGSAAHPGVGHRRHGHARRQAPDDRRGAGPDCGPATNPRRAVSGIDSARAAMIRRRAGERADCLSGGGHLPVDGRRMRLTDPSSDLAGWRSRSASAYPTFRCPDHRDRDRRSRVGR